LEILREDGLPAAGGMVHGFSGSVEVATAYASLGLHVSFSTAIARPHASKLRRAAEAIPGELLLVETDAPDQSPDPKSGGNNEPANLPLAIRALADARAVEPSTIATLTSRNARRLFHLEGGGERA